MGGKNVGSTEPALKDEHKRLLALNALFDAIRSGDIAREHARNICDSGITEINVTTITNEKTH